MGIMYKVLKHRYKQQFLNYDTNNSSSTSSTNSSAANIVDNCSINDNNLKQSESRNTTNSSNAENITNISTTTITLHNNCTRPAMDLRQTNKLNMADCHRRGRRRVSISISSENKLEESKLVLPSNIIAKDNNESDHIIESMGKEREFTAEHILQLCKFLAEKAKKNKMKQKIIVEKEEEMKSFNGIMVEESQNGLPNSMEDITAIGNKFHENDLSANHHENEHEQYEQYEQYEQHHHQQNIEVRELTLSSSSYENHHQHHHNPSFSGTHTIKNRLWRERVAAVSEFQSKRDILLLKIRRQIFERKRQRQQTQRMMMMGIGGGNRSSSSSSDFVNVEQHHHLGANVWRPW